MLHFRKYPLFWKLIVPVVVVTMGWGAVVWVATLIMKQAQHRSYSLYTRNVTHVLHLQELGQKFSEFNALLLAHVASGDGQQISRLRDEIDQMGGELENDFAAMEKAAYAAGHEQALTEFVGAHTAYHQYMNMVAKVLLLSEDFEKMAAFEKLQELTTFYQAPIEQALAKIVASEFAAMHKGYEQSQKTWRSNMVSLAVGGAAVLVVSLLFFFRVMSGITARMAAVASCAGKLRLGDLSARVEEDDSHDEISSLACDLGIMAAEIDRATQQLQDSEVQIRMLLDSTAEAIYGLDREGNCTFANKACLAMLGYEFPVELLGKNIHNLIHHSYPDGRPYPVEECRVHQSIQTGQVAHLDAEVLWRKDGSKFSAEYRSHPIRKDGEVVGAVVSFLDITDKKRAEEALQRSHNLLKDAQEIGRVGSWEWDIAGNTISWSDETYRMFGFAPQEFQATYEAFMERVHPDDRQLVQQGVQAALADEKPYDVNHRIVLVDGTERIVNEKGKVYRDEAGRPEVMVGTVLDITEMKKIEQDLRTYHEKLEILVAERTAELQKAKEEADKANQAKSLFLSSMSHELRTPLNSILGFGQLLYTDEKSPLSDAQKGHIKKVLKSGNHLLSLIDDVLNLSKIETGSLELSIEPVDAAVVLKETLELVQEIASRQNVTVVHEEAQEHYFIDVDETKFRQVVLNLLSNAIKYNRLEGTVTLASKEADGMLRVMVSDTGYGISPDQAELLFEPFSRLGAETSNIEGTGIGLTITKRLVEMMEGKIGYESEVGKGSMFWVEFPIVQSPAAKDSNAARPKPSMPELPAGDYTILYVEDNDYNRDLLMAILARTPSLKLLMAENGRQGVETARSAQPHLILMDIGLPGMDGFATLAELKKYPETQEIPVVALSGNAMPMDIQKAMDAGFVDYITKPMNIAELYRVVGEILSSLSQTDQE